jgi:tRNA:m4X modification enzyme
MANASKKTEAPPLPPDWTRCHSYIERKHRFCRQVRLPESNYCGYHQGHLNLCDAGVDGCSDTSKRRIPCPFDPSHDILEHQVEKHKKVCPKLTRQKEQETRPYYRHDINAGGHGEIGRSETMATDLGTSKWAMRIAAKVLEIHQRLYSVEVTTATQGTLGMTNDDIQNAIPMNDLSKPELEGGLPEAIEHFRIKSGGARHLHQQASLIGHLRRIGVLLPHPNQVSTMMPEVEFLEMGAGRGMLGLLAAGVAAACGAPKVRLVLVERAGARSKADTVLRKAKTPTTYMKLHDVDWSRIQCDLAHVHVPSILSNSQTCACTAAVGDKRKEPTNCKQLVVVAKHLCGAGTDLALKSLQGLDVDVCLMATCCHGVCSWDLYIGRNFLIKEFGNTPFGSPEFELLRKWSTGTVANGDKSDGEHHHAEFDERDPCSVSAVVRALNLKCGINGLGRACQRLLDGGRCDYMRNVLFRHTHDVEICHYVDSDVTPQNAILVAKRRPITA